MATIMVAQLSIHAQSRDLNDFTLWFESGGTRYYVDESTIEPPTVGTRAFWSFAIKSKFNSYLASVFVDCRYHVVFYNAVEKVRPNGKRTFIKGKAATRFPIPRSAKSNFIIRACNSDE